MNIDDEIKARAQALVAKVADEVEQDRTARERAKQAAMPGGQFIFNEPDEIPAVWGSGDEVLWAEGESLFLCGPGGVGKTTLSQRVILARIGLGTEVLGLPVAPSKSRVLYIAADRPRQAARSLKRMVAPEHADLIDQRLHVWRGPLEKYITEDREVLVRMCHEYDCDTVVIDSLKDVALDLSKDESGSRGNIALQATLAAGIDVMVLHHQRKGDGKSTVPDTISDVYGSVWFVNGAGSVVVLWGEAGDPVIKLKHLKQPAEPVGPFDVYHDQAAGTMEVQDQLDVYAMLKASQQGITGAVVAARMFPDDAASLTKNQVSKGQRKLESLRKKGYARKTTGKVTPGAGKSADLYFYTTPSDPDAGTIDGKSA